MIRNKAILAAMTKLKKWRNPTKLPSLHTMKRSEVLSITDIDLNVIEYSSSKITQVKAKGVRDIHHNTSSWAKVRWISVTGNHGNQQFFQFLKPSFTTKYSNFNNYFRFQSYSSKLFSQTFQITSISRQRCN